MGYDLLKIKCVVCHIETLFIDLRYRNDGLPEDDFLHDKGRMKITRDAKDYLAFKVPSLRNADLTAPYGHDGRFFSIMEVFQFYRKQIVNSPSTDSLLRKGLALSNYEIGQLTAFIRTLTDSVFINDKRFAPPGYESRMPMLPAERIH